MPHASPLKPTVVIVGGGFGGLYAARALRKAEVEVTLLDRRNHHLFQPLLYQVATGALSPANIAAPLRSLVKRQGNCRVEMAEVTGIDLAGRRVLLTDGERRYDYLIVATGVRHNYFGHDDWERVAPGLKTIEDATRIRAEILRAFETAERADSAGSAQAWLTFVVIGAGPTGVELAGALAEIARHTLRREFRRIDPASARIVLLEGGSRVLPAYPEPLSQEAESSLRRLGVEVQTDSVVTAIDDRSVTFRRQDREGPGREETLSTHTVLWAAGVLASPLGKALAEQSGAPLDRAGRVRVEPDLSLPGHPELFVIGDLADYPHQEGWKSLPGIAPVAMQQGSYVARLLRQGRPAAPPPFRYRHRGNMATIGRRHAVAEVGRWQFTGTLAWLAWLFVHLLYLVQFENRLLVLLQWAWNYLTRNRAARLITDSPAIPGIEDQGRTR